MELTLEGLERGLVGPDNPAGAMTGTAAWEDRHGFVSVHLPNSEQPEIRLKSVDISLEMCYAIIIFL